MRELNATAATRAECRDALAARYAAVRRLTEALAAPLSDADASVQSMPDASPAKWHLAHVSWFFEAFVLKPHVAGYRAFDERFAYLFNSYYEAEGARQPRNLRGLLTRPDLATVLAYRAHVDAAIVDALPGLSPAARALVELGTHHEEQHQELLLTDILHLFAQNPLLPSLWQEKSQATGDASAMHWVDRPGGIATIGHRGDGFAFDCEGPAHEVLIRPYRLANRPVTNAEWIAFIDDGGYRQPALWLSDGWAWVKGEGIEAPLYWRLRDGGWETFGLAGPAPVDLHAPVTHVSYFEADAFASWAGARLPTEAEWEVAAAPFDPTAGNFLDAAGPVAPASAGNHEGPQQMFGDVWEWTASPFTAYPGFRPADGAVGEYNGKFMCGQFVLRGGSCATPRGHVRASYRNFFYPHQRWQFTGVRLAKDA